MPPGKRRASIERGSNRDHERKVGTSSKKSKPQGEHAEDSEEDDHSKFMAAWAWKREHLPDKLRFHRSYKYPLDSPSNCLEVSQGSAADEIVIHQCQFQQEGFASTVWDSSIVMAKFFEHHSADIGSKRICDLSAGTGLVGVVLAKIGAQVTATDLMPNLPLIEKNGQANGAGVKLQVRDLLWGASAKHLQPPFDVVVACDVMYIEAAAQDLVATLSALSDARTVVYVAYGRNRCAEYDFLQAATDWDVAEVSEGELHPAFRAPDVSVLRMTMRPA